jgi:hypothetical protein
MIPKTKFCMICDSLHPTTYRDINSELLAPGRPIRALASDGFATVRS